MTDIWYCTREDVQLALDSKETARNNAQIGRLIGSSSRMVEGVTNCIFYPTIETRYFDWPQNQQYAHPWRLWLNQHRLVSVTQLTSGGVVIPPTDYNLWPYDGPPYQAVEINLGQRSAFTVASTYQRSIAITGTYGYRADEISAGTLAAAVASTTATTITVTDSSAVGVGHILRVDTERMIVTAKKMITTGQSLLAPLDNQASTVSLTVTDGTAYAVDETILCDAERMRIIDITGNTLIVKRAWDGSVLATHTGSTIYAPRQLVVTRGALGTTAAAHSSAAPIARHQVPSLINRITLAETLVGLQHEMSAYSRTGRAGSSDSQGGLTTSGLDELWAQIRTTYARQARIRAV